MIEPSTRENVPIDMCVQRRLNQPAHPRSLIGVFVVRMRKSQKEYLPCKMAKNTHTDTKKKKKKKTNECI